MNFTTRQATPDDEAFLRMLFEEVRADEFAAAKLPASVLAPLLDMQFKAQRQGYRERFPLAEDLIAVAGPYPVGRLLIAEFDDTIHIIDIAVLRAFRGSGIGSGLLQDLQQRASEANKKLKLEVRTGSAAVHLYERLGFVPVGEQGGMDVAMVWPAATAATPSFNPPPKPDAPAVLPAITLSYFRSVVGQTFQGIGDSGERVEFQLRSAESLGGAVSDRDDSFSLVFTCSSETAVQPQGTYRLQGSGVDELMFIVPIQSPEGVAYEATYNRTIPHLEAQRP